MEQFPLSVYMYWEACNPSPQIHKLLITYGFNVCCILLTKCKDHVGRVSALHVHVSLDSAGQVQWCPFKKVEGRYFPSMVLCKILNKRFYATSLRLKKRCRNCSKPGPINLIMLSSPQESPRSRSRSHSRSRSRSRSKNRSHSRSRSRSHHQRSKSQSRSKSRSRSPRRNRSHSKSPRHSRSRSKSHSKSRSRSKSPQKSRSRSHSRSPSRSPRNEKAGSPEPEADENQNHNTVDGDTETQ